MEQVSLSDRLQHTASVLELKDQYTCATWVREAKTRIDDLQFQASELLMSFNELWMAYSNMRSDYDKLKALLDQSNIIVERA